MIYIFALAIISNYNKYDSIEFYHISKTFLYDCYKTSGYYIDILNFYIKTDNHEIHVKNIQILTIINFIYEYKNKFCELF